MEEEFGLTARRRKRTRTGRDGEKRGCWCQKRLLSNDEVVMVAAAVVLHGGRAQATCKYKYIHATYIPHTIHMAKPAPQGRNWGGSAVASNDGIAGPSSAQGGGGPWMTAVDGAAR